MIKKLLLMASLLVACIPVMARTIKVENNLQSRATIEWFRLSHMPARCDYQNCVSYDTFKSWDTGTNITYGNTAESDGGHLSDWTWDDVWHFIILIKNGSELKLYDTIWMRCDIANNTSVLTFYVNRLNVPGDRDIHIDADGSGQCDFRNDQIRQLIVVVPNK